MFSQNTEHTNTEYHTSSSEHTRTTNIEPTHTHTHTFRAHHRTRCGCGYFRCAGCISCGARTITRALHNTTEIESAASKHAAESRPRARTRSQHVLINYQSDRNGPSLSYYLTYSSHAYAMRFIDRPRCWCVDNTDIGVILIDSTLYENVCSEAHAHPSTRYLPLWFSFCYC